MGMRRTWLILLAVACVAFATHAAPMKIGEEIFKGFDTPHPYAAAREGTIDLVWKDVITHPGAAYIAPHFSRFNLAPGDYVIVRSPDGSRSWRYEGLGKGTMGESAGGFWGIHIAGDTAIVELFSSNPQSGFGYTIDKYARGYRDEEMGITTPESSQEMVCGNDDSQEAKCLLDAGETQMYDKSRTVARLNINGTSGCTGWLIGNAGHLMTNQHCITSAADAANTDYEFMAEGLTCATNCATGNACPGPIVATSATLVQVDANLDFSLVLLPVNASATYGFLRLRNALPATDERIYLPGHPALWGKRIVSASDHPVDGSGFCEISGTSEPPCVAGATYTDVGYFCDTQGGSSGSPVISYVDHKVVSLHHCRSTAGCTATGGDPNVGVPIPNIITALGPNLPPGSVFDPAGTVKLDKDRYGCVSTINIEVRDDSLIGTGSLTVTIQSTTEAVAETVTLTETPAGSGVFVGSIAAGPPPAVNADGILSVLNGDTITVTYIDADDGAGGVNVPRTDTAVVDCVGPIITNVQAVNVTGNSADLTWDTNEPANSAATYALAPGPPSITATSPTLVTSHSVHITGLVPCSNWVFRVASTDAAGNSASADNGGNYYTFTTGANTTPIYTYTGGPIAIPDNSPAGALAQINVADVGQIQDLNVKVNITHTFDGDLVLELIGPDNTTVTLSNRRGSSGANFVDTVFDDQAATSITTGVAPFTGSFKPEGLLSAFNGKFAAGTWTLKVVDQAGIDTGNLTGFEMQMAFPPVPCGQPVLSKQSHSVTESCSGTGSGGDGVIDPDEDLSIPVQLVNVGAGAATAVSATLSTLTPGVTVTLPTVGYPDIGIGQSAFGSQPFTVRVGGSVACGTVIQFQVDMVASQGTWSGSFQVRVGAPVYTNVSYSSLDTPKPIVDVRTPPTTSTIAVPDPGVLGDVNVTINLTHTWDSDLDIFLIGPNGTRVELTTDNGSSSDNYTNTVFDDQAATSITAGTAPFTGTFKPEGSLATLNGIPAIGAWTLEITDDTGGDSGNLLGWSLQLTIPAGYACNDVRGHRASSGRGGADAVQRQGHRGMDVGDSGDRVPRLPRHRHRHAEGDHGRRRLVPSGNDGEPHHGRNRRGPVGEFVLVVARARGQHGR